MYEINECKYFDMKRLHDIKKYKQKSEGEERGGWEHSDDGDGGGVSQKMCF